MFDSEDLRKVYCTVLGDKSSAGWSHEKHIHQPMCNKEPLHIFSSLGTMDIHCQYPASNCLRFKLLLGYDRLRIFLESTVFSVLVKSYLPCRHLLQKNTDHPLPTEFARRGTRFHPSFEMIVHGRLSLIRYKSHFIERILRARMTFENNLW